MNKTQIQLQNLLMALICMGLEEKKQKQKNPGNGNQYFKKYFHSILLRIYLRKKWHLTHPGF